MEAYTDVATHVRDELRRAWLRLEYEIRIGWRRETAAAQVGADIIGPDDMGRLFAQARGAPSTDDAGARQVLDSWLALHEEIEGRIRAGGRSPLVQLRTTFELTARQWGTLMFALLPEIDPNLVQGYRYLSRDPNVRGLDGRLLAQLVYDTPQTRSRMARDLAATSPLLRYRLLDATADSLMFKKLRAASRLVYLLDGGALDLDPELAEIAELRTGDVAGAFPQLAVDRATAALRSNEVVLALQGQRGVGKRLLLQVAAAQWKQRVLLIDTKRLAQQPLAAQPLLVRGLVRELELLDAVPAFAEADDAVVTDSDRDAMPGCFDMFLDEWAGPVALTITRERMPRIHQRPLVHLTLEVPPLPVRAAMWRQVVPALSSADADALAGRFAIPGGVIVAAAQAAAAGHLPGAPGPAAADLDQAVAAQLHVTSSPSPVARTNRRAHPPLIARRPRPAATSARTGSIARTAQRASNPTRSSMPSR